MQLNFFQRLMLFCLGLFLIGMPTGCLEYDGKPKGTFVWGRKGFEDGRLFTPRAITVNDQDELFIVDKLGRIQRFDVRGKFICGWRTPEQYAGKPVGLGISHDGLVMVADTHYFRVLFYTVDGKLIEDRTIGGTNGRGKGEFGFVTDVAQDSKGNYYVSDYNGFDRIQKFTPDGEFVCQIGSNGSEVGQFKRPQCMIIDDQDRLWTTDTHNDRVQVFQLNEDSIEPLFQFGEHGKGEGQLLLPYGIDMDDDGNVYVTEYGNHRIQKFDASGKSLGLFGKAGKMPGGFSIPYGLAIDSEGALNVVDTGNNRVQRFHFVRQE